MIRYDDDSECDLPRVRNDALARSVRARVDHAPWAGAGRSFAGCERAAAGVLAVWIVRACDARDARREPTDPRLADERVAVLFCLVADVNSLVVLRLAESAPIVVRREGSDERDTLHAVGDAAFVRLGDHIVRAPPDEKDEATARATTRALSSPSFPLAQPLTPVRASLPAHARFAGDSPYVYRYDLLRHGEAMPRAAANALSSAGTPWRFENSVLPSSALASKDDPRPPRTIPTRPRARASASLRVGPSSSAANICARAR